MNARLQKYCNYYETPNTDSSYMERRTFIENKYMKELYAKPRQQSGKEQGDERLAHYFLMISKKHMLLPEVDEEQLNACLTLFATNESEARKKLNELKRKLKQPIPRSLTDLDFDPHVLYRSRSLCPCLLVV